jgi:hypothetical protein
VLLANRDAAVRNMPIVAVNVLHLSLRSIQALRCFFVAYLAEPCYQASKDVITLSDKMSPEEMRTIIEELRVRGQKRRELEHWREAQEYLRTHGGSSSSEAHASRSVND